MCGEMEVEEWRGTEYQINDYSVDVELDHSIFMEVFDWYRHFYQYLEKQPKTIKYKKWLSELISNEKYYTRLKKRGSTFNLFVIKFVG